MLHQFRKKHISGFSFIELNVAIALFIIAVVAILGILTYCATAAKKTRELSQCAHLAQAKVAETLYLTSDQIIETTNPVPFPAPFESYRYAIKKLTPSDPKLAGLQELKITVTGSTGAKTDLISMLAPPGYMVTYDGNGSTGGTAPIDNNRYTPGPHVIVRANTGNLVKIQDELSLLFVGWNTQADGLGTNYSPGATLIISSANVTLYAKWTALRATGPAGGLVFYDKGSYSDGWRYMEAAPESTEWTYRFWSTNPGLVGGTGTTIGTGQANTAIIVNWLNARSESGKPAQLCDGLVYRGYSDWFLPSKDELNKIFINLQKGTDENGVLYRSVGRFREEHYWSSSEAGSNYAWTQRFLGGGFGGQNNSYKWIFQCGVRAVRYF